MPTDQEIINQIKILIDENEVSRGINAKAAVVYKVYDILVANPWFIKQNDRFRFTVINKLVELQKQQAHNDIGARLLQYWKTLYAAMYPPSSKIVEIHGYVDTPHPEIFSQLPTKISKYSCHHRLYDSELNPIGNIICVLLKDEESANALLEQKNITIADQYCRIFKMNP
jgi:hypothetical protein